VRPYAACTPSSIIYLPDSLKNCKNLEDLDVFYIMLVPSTGMNNDRGSALNTSIKLIDLKA
jgi:hypothetical protein